MQGERGDKHYCLMAKTLLALLWIVPSTLQLSGASRDRRRAFARGRSREFDTARSATCGLAPRCDSRQHSDLPTVTASKG